jgi:HEAT repeat protein
MSMVIDERDRDSVLQGLQDEDDEVRRLAVERIDALSADNAVAALVDCLGDSSWRVRKAAIERLVACVNVPDAVDALISALGDGENPGRRNAAVDALIHFGPIALPALLEMRSSDDIDVRKLIVDALAGIADPRSREPLKELLEDSDPNVRAAAADALGAIGGGEVVPALLAKATNEDEDQLVRFSSIHALSALEFPIRVNQLGSVLNDPVLSAASLSLLGRADDDEAAIEELLKALGSRSRSCREASIRALIRVLGRSEPSRVGSVAERIRSAAAANEATVASAIDRLSEADLSMRLALIQFLGIVATRRSILPILLAGQDEALSHVALSTLSEMGEMAEEVVDGEWSGLGGGSRRDACVLFGQTHGERSAVRLLSALDDGLSEVRTAAARSIGNRRLAAGIAPLVRRLAIVSVDDDFEAEEEFAAFTDGLIELASPENNGGSDLTQRAIELLSDCLVGADQNTRLAIAKVIGRIGRSEDSQIVSFLLKDPSSAVRRASVEALARLEPGTDAEPLRLALADESAMVRIAAARALGASQSEHVVDDLKRLADDEDLQVRAEAVRSVILRFGESECQETRIAVSRMVEMALTDEAPVALAAIDSLCEVGGPDAESAVSLLARPEPEVIREAIRCIGLHGDAASLDEILRFISHSEWSVRAEAIQTVADRAVVRGVPAILRRLDMEQDDFVRGITLRALKKLESGVG